MNVTMSSLATAPSQHLNFGMTKAHRLMLLFCLALVISVSTLRADVVSVPFNEGFIGTKGTNVQKANNIVTFADLGFTAALVQQNSTSGQFESPQGNDIPVELVVSKGSTVLTILGTISWKVKSGNNLQAFGFVPYSNAVTYVISYAGGSYTLNATSNYGVV